MLFIVDFDGTVAPSDTVDALLERFADPSWKAIEEDWVAGRLNSRECMDAQLALVRADRATLDDFFRSIAIDPSFPRFVRFVQAFADIAVVSDGLDYPIRLALHRHEITTVPVFANALAFGEDALSLSFPHADAACVPRSGLCKCAVARQLDRGRNQPVVLVGDGRSDFCIAHSADYVFAKSSLLAHCRDRGIAHTAFDSFNDVLAIIRTWDPVQMNRKHERRHVRQ